MFNALNRHYDGLAPTRRFAIFLALVAPVAMLPTVAALLGPGFERPGMILAVLWAATLATGRWRALRH